MEAMNRKAGQSKLSRADLIGLLQFAGYHGDRSEFTRLYVEHRVSLGAATEAY